MLVVVSFTSGLGLSVLITNKVLIEPMSLLTSLHFLSRQRWFEHILPAPLVFSIEDESSCNDNCPCPGHVELFLLTFWQTLGPPVCPGLSQIHICQLAVLAVHHQGGINWPVPYPPILLVLSTRSQRQIPSKLFRQTHTCQVAPLCVHYTDKCYIIF